MASAVTMVVATAGIVTLGRWSENKPLSARVVVGAGGMVLFLALLGETNDKLGRSLAALVLLIAAFLYVPTIAYNAGLTNIKPPKWEWEEGPDPLKQRRFRPRPPRPGHGGTARGGAA